MLPEGVSTRSVNEWVAQGRMTPDEVLRRLRKDSNDRFYNGDLASDLEVNPTFDTVVTEDESRLHLDEAGFTSILERHNAVSDTPKDASPILFHALYGLSRYPFPPVVWLVYAVIISARQLLDIMDIRLGCVIHAATGETAPDLAPVSVPYLWDYGWHTQFPGAG